MPEFSIERVEFSIERVTSSTCSIAGMASAVHVRIEIALNTPVFSGA